MRATTIAALALGTFQLLDRQRADPWPHRRDPTDPKRTGGFLRLSGRLPCGLLLRDSRSSVRSIQFEIERPSRSATFSIASRKAGVIHTLTEAVRVPRRAIANRPLRVQCTPFAYGYDSAEDTMRETDPQRHTA